MKRTRNLIILVGILISAVAFTQTGTVKKVTKVKKSRTCVLEDVATAGIGDIKFSMLTEAKFQMVNGNGWILMDGQNKANLIALGIVDASDNNTVFEYLTTTNFPADALPLVGGRFLRARNTANSNSLAEANPAGYSQLGKFQPDMFDSHKHTLMKAGGGASPYGTTHVSIWNFGTTSLGDDSPEPVVAAGGAETRPRNVTFNVFVKVKRNCLDAIATAKRAENEARIQAIEDFNLANVCDTCLPMPETNLTEQRAKNVCFKGDIEAYEAGERAWSISCVARAVGSNKKVLMLIGAPNRTTDENTWLDHLDNQYPYYNVISE